MVYSGECRIYQKEGLLKLKKESKKKLYIAVWMLIAFVAWTVCVCFVDVRAIGPTESEVGFSTVNQFVHNLTGVHMSLYIITDWLGLVPLIFVVGFGIMGFVQLVKRRHILKVDYSILALGGFYIVVFTLYLLFEIFIINYRPILIDGILEASYPSSTTMLVMCIIPTAIMQFNIRIKSKILRSIVLILLSVFIAFMVVCRLVSGVHWFSDIIGGALLSTGLVTMYSFLINKGASF